MATLDLSQFKLSFDDEFNNLSLRSAGNPNGTWDSLFASGDHTLPSNGEQEYYVDPNAQASLGVNPFSTANGVLNIEAKPTPAADLSQTQNLPYTSGVITTDHSYSQTYGYFEMRAELPAGQGLWPAFWLLPTDHSWPPEIDVVEQLGNQPTVDHTTIHSTAVSGGQIGQGNTVADTSAGFHTYGVDWEPNTVTFYFDGQEVFQTATPSDMHKPMYMLANLAVGGSWPGNPDGTTHFPADMQIDYIRAYASPNTVITPGNTAPAPMTTADSTPGATDPAAAAPAAPTAPAAAAAPTAAAAAAAPAGDSVNLNSLMTNVSHGTLPSLQGGDAPAALSFDSGHLHLGSFDIGLDQLSTLADLGLSGHHGTN